MTVVRVRQHYRYVYTAPVRDLRQQLIMVPPDRHADQVLRSWGFDVRGTTGALAINWTTDRFGNRVCDVTAEHVPHAVDFEAVFTVERRARCEPLEIASNPRFSEFTPLTAPNDAIREAAAAIESQTGSPEARTELAHTWAAQSILYELGVTGTRTPAAMALHLGRGVCQDFSHILLSVLRCMNIPCRYVSGHLLGEGAPHAWVEVLLSSGLVALDPTHHRRVGMDYVTVAVGRDFADVTMTSGVFTGAATGRLHWSKQAEIVELDEAEHAAA
ncbi:MAG: transglutaminase family protein [Chloroflexi bacterium]|nr:transglutaminase family protein [Chloroflexota bacterium]MBV9543500.1 transglutaminase family protein [Chloroflexota bacterium]